ncbi:DUF4147 domain-containing protein [Leptospira sp. 2 VSF19]|uniref:DUF4147 domain-containing protein n=1 Tax=Leptospira soteropolitanensis TaxID=2950025 RepID=A0AAW5VMK3_9LEPT|nr:DUF4147 domain-containing protein [Leptospira soteropolitanensis]MCW7493618.1 DUF4147 domain-containing protein [Leptospira soteropolitanensis]MCW7501217.1 DUF4147 domain-containing protein [Leptospira soteropolitanensis]MCW7523597.1 DUF4147 domain-containing protein [Leptospira soteropolitanensis]MCW7527330.1 DUF4147 domain-containing protein [Leptospira soteropolitanensis]MCW7531187.1 DUF4147 domain-containing protein [Leptospira soteropolitanensis]
MNSLREDIEFLFWEGVRAATPKYLSQRFWNLHPDLKDELNHSNKKTYVFALGKAAFTMALSFQESFSVDSGFILTKYEHLPNEFKTKGQMGVWKCREASHPIPDKNTELYSREVLQELLSLDGSYQLVVLLSGGGSSLFEIPEEGFVLDDLIQLNEKLLKTGLSIYEINAERKKYSAVKAGKLLKHLNPNLKVYSLAISDVLGDDPAVIASGPTYPGSIYYVTGNLFTSLSTMENTAKNLGYNVKVISDSWDLSSEETAKRMLGELILANENNQKQAILLGGELVCPVRGNGKGGRNQETTLRMAILSESICINRDWLFLSCGTDGTDGPTDAAGGIVGPKTLSQMKNKGWDVRKELAESNSYPVLKDTNSLLFTGATGTNVNDLLILLLGERDL